MLLIINSPDVPHGPRKESSTDFEFCGFEKNYPSVSDTDYFAKTAYFHAILAIQKLDLKPAFCDPRRM